MYFAGGYLRWVRERACVPSRGTERRIVQDLAWPGHVDLIVVVQPGKYG